MARCALPPSVEVCRLPPVSHEEIRDRAQRIRSRIERAAARADRNPAEVRVLPITKGHAEDVVRAVVAAGFEQVGENRVSEAEQKREVLSGLSVDWVMVGHVQRNKASRVVDTFDRVESVDSLRLARRLADEAEKRSAGRLPVLVQVNASGESSKGGFAVEDGPRAIGAVCALPGLRVQGLMTMAPFVDDVPVLRAVFRRTRELHERCRNDFPAYLGEILSMGMSNDFELAVEEGSTELRLGTILVGERPGR